MKIGGLGNDICLQEIEEDEGDESMKEVNIQLFKILRICWCRSLCSRTMLPHIRPVHRLSF